MSSGGMTYNVLLPSCKQGHSFAHFRSRAGFYVFHNKSATACLSATTGNVRVHDMMAGTRQVPTPPYRRSPRHAIPQSHDACPHSLALASGSCCSVHCQQALQVGLLHKPAQLEPLPAPAKAPGHWVGFDRHSRCS